MPVRGVDAEFLACGLAAVAACVALHPSAGPGRCLETVGGWEMAAGPVVRIG